jgi:hypothetical protein
MFLDEFPSIGYMPIIKKGSGYIAGFKLKLLTIYQNISQLNEIYGIEGAKTLMSAHPAGLSMLSVKKMMLKRFQKSWAISPLNRLVPVKQAVVRHQKAVQKVTLNALLCSTGAGNAGVLKKNLSF